MYRRWGRGGGGWWVVKRGLEDGEKAKDSGRMLEFAP